MVMLRPRSIRRGRYPTGEILSEVYIQQPGDPLMARQGLPGGWVRRTEPNFSGGCFGEVFP